MTDYDRVPYPCHPYADTHPDHLHALARLHGMEPAPAERCRVLEVGCGDAANLLPMAARLPESRFTGFDLAETSIAAGQAAAAEWGLTNLDLHHMDLMDFPQDGEPYDYIIAHGFYSWVPAAVRERLLALIGRVLAPQGVALVSYNAMPGAHLRSMVRGMLRFHTAGTPDGQPRLAHAQEFLSFLHDGMADADEHGRLLRAEVERVRNYNPSHFYHDDMAAINDAFYLHEFAAQAGAHGLQYLADADFSSSHDNRFPPEVRSVLAEKAGDRVLHEQYLDFLKCRRFRATLLCHAGRTLHSASPAALRTLWCGGALELTGPDQWRSPRGAQLRCSHPVARAALDAIGARWPERWDFPSLATAVEAQTGGPREAVEEVLEKVLWESLCTGMIDAWPRPAPCAAQVSERPAACAVARRMAACGSSVVTLLHGPVGISDPIGRHLLRLCDGTRSHADLVQALAALPELAALPDAASRTHDAEEKVSTGLTRLARLALLVA